MSPLGGPGGGANNPAAGRMMYSGAPGASAALRPSSSRGSLSGRGAASPGGATTLQSEVFCAPLSPQKQQPAPPAASSRLKLSSILPNLMPGKKK